MGKEELVSPQEHNQRIEGVTLINKSDTAGFLFSPCRAEYDNITKTLQLTDNTLQDIIRDELLSRAILWLLGYSADSYEKKLNIDDQINSKPIRAQSNGSHWETAWCIIHFLDVLPIFTEKHPSIVREIKRRFSEDDIEINPLKWLLSQFTSEETIPWYGKEYDTAVITLSLLRIKAEHSIELPKNLMNDLDKKLYYALRWLFDHLKDSIEAGKVDEEAPEVLEPLIYAEAFFPSLFLEVLASSTISSNNEFYNILWQWFSYFKAQFSPREEKSEIEFGIGANAAYCLCRLVLTWQQNEESQEKCRLVKQAQILLLHYIEFLEKWLARDQWGGNLNRVWRLGTYVEACASVGLMRQSQNRQAFDEDSNPANSAIVLKVLSMVKNEFFPNGSIFHSVYPTTYFVHSLLSIWKWSESSKTITHLYHDLLDRFVIGISLERKNNFELRHSLIECESNLSSEKERYKGLIFKEGKKRYGLLGLSWFMFNAAILIFAAYNLTSFSDWIKTAGVSVPLTAIFLTFLEIFILREKGLPMK